MADESIEVMESAVGGTENIPTIDNEEELLRHLGITKDAPIEKTPAEAATEELKNKAKAPEKEDSTSLGKSAFGTDEDEDEKDPVKLEAKKKAEEEAAAAARKDKKVSDYPTIVHWLNDQRELGMNLKDIETLTPEEQGEAMVEVIDRMTTGVNQAVEEYQYIETLMQDPEVKSLLEAKASGKGLKDLYTQFSESPSSLDDETLALKEFKTKYPKASEEAIRGMVDSLKKSSQFDPFVKGLREQYDEEQSFSKAEREKQEQLQVKAQAESQKRELDEFNGFVGNLTNVHGVPLTPDMKQAVVKIATQRDEKGMTYLDNALQSNEGVVLASLGIAFMRDLLQNAASLQGNRKNAKLIDKLFSSADKLQSGGGQEQKEDAYDPTLLNRF